MPNFSKFTKRPPLNQRLQIALSIEEKRQAFDMADKRGASVSHLVRIALARLAEAEQRAA